MVLWEHKLYKSHGNSVEGRERQHCGTYIQLSLSLETFAAFITRERSLV